MKNQTYNRHDNYALNNIEDYQVPLLINCAGVTALSRPFETYMPEGRNDFFFFYLYKGELDVDCGGRLQPMRAGQLLCYAPHTPYRYRKTDHSEMDYLWLHFTGSEAASLLELCGFAPGRLYSIGIHEEMLSYFEALFREFIRNDAYSDAACRAEAERIFLLLARLYQSGKRLEPGLPSFQASKEYMHRNFASPVSACALASLENLSPSRYRAAFRQQNGLSPSEYLMGLRMRNACTLLEQTNLSVQEVAAASGYPDPFYFSRIFKKNIGMPPSAYRASTNPSPSSPISSISPQSIQ